MKQDDCRFHGKHRFRLHVVEECAGCGHRRRRSRTSRIALWLVPAALWTNALLLAALVLG
ncbi:hypothetical protein [Tsuneonella sp. SYSU-LHT278]|uniref:hypothetical protein n=1 Tax=Tsuneonella sediminis TaxID=3416089 RepID=UPI003F7AA8CF